jgi:hypothetical protein
LGRAGIGSPTIVKKKRGFLLHTSHDSAVTGFQKPTKEIVSKLSDPDLADQAAYYESMK